MTRRPSTFARLVPFAAILLLVGPRAQADDLTFAGTKFRSMGGATVTPTSRNYYRVGESGDAWSQQLFFTITPDVQDPEKVAQSMVAAAASQVVGGTQPTVVHSGNDTFVAFTYDSKEGLGLVTLINRVFRDETSGRVRTYAVAQRPAKSATPLLTVPQAISALRMLPSDLPRTAPSPSAR